MFINKVIYSLCLVNIGICLAVAPFQLFYVTLILQWQEEVSVSLLMTGIWCSVIFTLIAILNFYITYNKSKQHWSGLNKNMRFLVVGIFFIFGQVLAIMLLKYRLPKHARSTFVPAMDGYYNEPESLAPYVDATQRNGECCGYTSPFDWDLVKNPLPFSCCPVSAMSGDLCLPQHAYSKGCRAFFDHIITFGSGIPLFTNIVILLTSLPVYIIIMTYIQFSHVVEYEELQSSTFPETSVGEGTHQSWRTSKSSSCDSANEVRPLMV